MNTTTTSYYSYKERVERDREYTDIDLRFINHPVTGDITILREIESIKNAVRNIILTEPGDKPFEPEYGVPLNSMLFNLFSLNPLDLETVISKAINKYENRVRITEKDVIVKDDHDSNATYIQITFVPLRMKEEVSLEISIKRTK